MAGIIKTLIIRFRLMIGRMVIKLHLDLKSTVEKR